VRAIYLNDENIADNPPMAPPHQSEALTKLTALREIRKKQAAMELQRQRLVVGLDSLIQEDCCLAQYQVGITASHRALIPVARWWGKGDKLFTWEKSTKNFLNWFVVYVLGH
jgi:hypothetical protein